MHNSCMYGDSTVTPICITNVSILMCSLKNIYFRKWVCYLALFNHPTICIWLDMPYTTNNIVFYFLNKQNNSFFKKRSSSYSQLHGEFKVSHKKSCLNKKRGNKHIHKSQSFGVLMEGEKVPKEDVSKRKGIKP